MSNSPHPPLKRHVSLQPFSRDHYTGLVQAQHLIKSADAGPGERLWALAEFLHAWTTDISIHFADEERLLPELTGGEPLERLRQEHRALAERAEAARSIAARPDPDPEWVRQLGQMLNDHIRWEERELFPLIEGVASAGQLEALGEETAKIEESRPRNIRRKRSGQEK